MTNRCLSCHSCGMTMEKPEDYALGDSASVYCTYCTDKAGKLLPFDTVLKANAGFFKESQGLTEQAALKMATDMLKNQPAWK